jgi:hypothetical protein
MGKLSEKFRKWFRKPWSSIYSTEMFSKGFWDKWNRDMEGKELVVLEKALVFLCSRSEQLTHATTLPRYGMGLSPKFIWLSAGSVTTI